MVKAFLNGVLALVEEEVEPKSFFHAIRVASPLLRQHLRFSEGCDAVREASPAHSGNELVKFARLRVGHLSLASLVELSRQVFKSTLRHWSVL